MKFFVFGNKKGLLVALICLHGSAIFTMCSEDQAELSDYMHSVKHAGAYYVADFAQYALLRTIDPTQRLLSTMPMRLQQAVLGGGEIFKKCATQYQNVKHFYVSCNPLLAAVAGSPTIVDRLMTTNVGKLLCSYPVAVAAAIGASQTPEREVHRLIAGECAHSLFPRTAQVAKKSEIIAHSGRALTCYRAIKTCARYARPITAFSIIAGYGPIPYVSDFVFFPEITAAKMGDHIEGAKQRFGMRQDSTGTIILDYTAEQVRRDLPTLIWCILHKVDRAIERSLAAQQAEPR